MIGKRRIVWGGALLTAALGLLASFSRTLENASYDVLSRLQLPADLSQENVVLVEMDDASEKRLDQTAIEPWDRRLHGQLLDRLRDQGTELVAFDVLFRNADTNLSSADQALLQAARRHGNVLFAAGVEDQQGPLGESLGPGIVRPLGEAVPLENLGLVEQAKRSDLTIRRHFTTLLRVPSLAWRAAQRTLAEPPLEPNKERWLRYYGAPDALPHVSYYLVLSNAIPPSLQLSNKVVFVGARAQLGPTGGTGTDYFRTPFDQLAPGVEINALTYLNLARGDWLRRWPRMAEGWILVLTGILPTLWLTTFRPWRAVLFGTLLALGAFLLTLGVFWFADLWFPWLVVLWVQLPCATAWSVLVGAAEASHPTPPIPLPALDAPAQPQASAANAPGNPSIPDHTLLRRVGQGAYGEVWLARDVLGNYHAVKLVFRHRFAGSKPYEREFNGLQKYTPISRLHPGWVHVLHVGRNDDAGYFYCIMEAGDDENSGPAIDPNHYQPKTLAGELQRRGRFPLPECVQLGLALADALEHLHQHRLIHRDVKPSNVIFVRGAPKFADIGLVTEMQTSRRDVSYLGTEGYMAPEGPGTSAADVYSLGKLLYEISMGRDRREFPEPSTTLAEQPEDGLRGRFTEILYRACALEAKDRYASAASLRADLQELQTALNQP